MLEIEICVDCLTYLANGEVFDANGEDIAVNHAAKITGVWGDNFPTLGGDDAGFSWQSCDGCGTRLGGDRFTAYVA
jgi:hypothetical protein